MANRGIENTMGLMAVEYDNVQKKTFTKWVNTHLINAGMRVNDLYEDFRDGIRLITLLELLTKEKLKREKGKMRVHRRLNCQTALDCLDRHKVKLVGITSDSIVDGNKKLILGLVWTLILHFQLSSGGEGSTAEVKKELLAWAQTAVEPYDLSVKNFSHDWSDGKVFCAVLHRHRPDIIDYSKVEDSPPQANLELAFDTAYDKLGVEKLLDPEDVAVSNPDEKSILTYVSFLRQQFPTMPPAPKRGPAVSPDDYKSLHDDLTKWAEDKLEEVKDRDFPKSLPEMMSLKKDFQKYLTGELPTKTHEKMQLAEMAAALEASKKASPDLFAQYPMDKLNKTWVELGAETAARKKAIDEEIKRLEDLEALAKQTKETCDEADKKMDKIEDKMKQLSEEMEKLTPESCSKMLNKIKKDLEGVSVPVKEVRGNCDKLEDGHYWDMDAVKPKVDSTEEKYEELKKKLAELEEAAVETGGVKEKVADLHKRFQEVTGWKAGKEFAATKDEKKDFLDKANEEFAELLADPKLAPHVPDTLAAQHDIANKHWEELCKLQESEKEAEKSLQELKDLKTFSAEKLADLTSRAPLADTLDGVRKQKKDHEEFVAVVTAKKPEVMKYAKLSVKCQSTELLDTIKREHAGLGKQWAQLMQKQQKWGKLLNACLGSWEKAVEVEGDLKELEEWLAKWGPPAEDQAILMQNADLQVFEKDQVAPFREKMEEMRKSFEKLKALGGHPPVNDFVEKLEERFEWLSSSLEARKASAEDACSTAQEFTEKQQPFHEWVTEATSDVKSLFPVELDKEKLAKAKEKLGRIQQDARDREEEVTAICTLADAFDEKRKPIVKEVSDYHSKLKSVTPPPVDMAAVKASQVPPTDVCPIVEQAAASKRQWDWILKQSIEQLDTVKELADRVEEFEGKQKALKDFIEEGKALLEKEKPVSENSARLKEQLDTCKDYRNVIDEKQPEVDTTLALGRDLLTSPHTSAQNQPFEEGLTDTIKDWSDLQLAWEDWYRELQSANDKSSAAAERFAALKNWLDQAKSRTNDIFPIKPESASVQSDLQDAKGSFTQEVDAPCARQKEVVDSLKADLSLLSDPEEAEKLFEEFEKFAQDVDDKKQKLEDALRWADRYDREKSPMEQTLEALERKLTEEKALPPDSEGIEDHEQFLDSLEKERLEKTPGVEEYLRNLEESKDLKEIMEPDVFEKEKDSLEKRWDRVKDEIDARKAKVEEAKEKNKAYHDVKDPFCRWLAGAEKDKKKLKRVPKGRRKLKKYLDNIGKFKTDVDDHDNELTALEEAGKAFVDAAKDHDDRLDDYRTFVAEENPAALEPTHSGSTPKRPTKEENGCQEVASELDDTRQRYNNLKLQTDARKGALDGAKEKRDPVEGLIADLLPQLEALETKCAPLMANGPSKTEPEEIREDVKLADTCELECSNLERDLQNLEEEATKWFDARDGDQETSVDGLDGVDYPGASSSEDEDDVQKEKEDLKDRCRNMKEFLAGKRGALEDSLSNADKLQADLERVDKWLEPREKKRPDMKPGAVRSKPLQEQVKEAEDFAQELSDFQPEMDRIANSLPSATAVNGSVNAEADHVESPMAAKCRECLQRFEDLKTDVTKRLDMLADLKPKVENVESGLRDVDDQVKEWEEWAERIKAMDTANVGILRQQAQEIYSLKAKVEALEQAKWSEVQADAQDLLDYNVGPFGEVSTTPSPVTANGTQPSPEVKSKKKKSKSKKKGKSKAMGNGSDSVAS